MMEQETVKPLTAEEYLVAYNTGYQAGLAKAQRDDDDAFWIRQYAGMAMQGLIVGVDKPKYEVIAMLAVKQATALLDEVKKHEATDPLS